MDAVTNRGLPWYWGSLDYRTLWIFTFSVLLENNTAIVMCPMLMLIVIQFNQYGFICFIEKFCFLFWIDNSNNKGP